MFLITDVSFPMLVNGKKSFRAQRLIRKCSTAVWPQRIFSSESGALPPDQVFFQQNGCFVASPIPVSYQLGVLFFIGSKDQVMSS